MRILILEDDKDLGPWIANGLSEEGHVVDLFTNGKDALVAATINSFDLFILDRMVPEIDGLSVLKSLRAQQNKTPAIFLSALGEVEDRVEGLQAGGDDYLMKPFAFIELSARVQALARRPKSAVQDIQAELKARDLTLNLVKRECVRAGVIIDLSAKEFQLLEYFMRRPERLVTRTMLLEQVWSLSFDPTTSVVETHISRLRNKIDRDFEHEFIKTRRGEGYVFSV